MEIHAKDAIPRPKIFATFQGDDNTSLPSLARKLLESQKMGWNGLGDAYDGLVNLQKRRIGNGAFSMLLQCNPGRIMSTGAAVDPRAINKRPCFLCCCNLPPLQEAILYRRTLLVLCNPMPIFPLHFTIAHIDHVSQVLDRALPFLSSLSRDFYPGFALLYNGPQCGASAPDHFHLQAVPDRFIPVLSDGMIYRKKILEKSGISLFRFEDGIVPLLSWKAGINIVLIISPARSSTR